MNEKNPKPTIIFKLMSMKINFEQRNALEFAS